MKCHHWISKKHREAQAGTVRDTKYNQESLLINEVWNAAVEEVALVIETGPYTTNAPTAATLARSLKSTA